MSKVNYIVLLIINCFHCTPVNGINKSENGEIWGSPCKKNDDCGKEGDLAYYVCMDKVCHCITYKNFVYNKTSKSCQVIDPCYNDHHCQDLDLIDKNRLCYDGLCLCKTGFIGVYDNGHKCSFNYIYLLFLIIPAAIIAIIVACLFKRSKFYKKINKRIIQSIHPTNTNKYRYKYSYTGYFKDEFDEPIEIGCGSFGTVVKAREKSTGKFTAIKILRLPNDSDTVCENKFQELEILIEVQSKYVVKYENSWFEKSTNCLFIQTELCQANLKNILAIKAKLFRRKKYEKMCSAEYFISCELFRELIECLNYLHTFEPPIIHRDLKPANILISYHPNNNRFLRLCDFGLAKHHDRSYHTPVVGTMDYMAPEVNRGGYYNTQADIYSLGIVAEELFEFNIHKVSSTAMVSSPAYIRNLRDTIIRMLNSVFNERPSCDQLLFSVNTWTINKEDVREECGQVLQTLRESCNEFFSKFLEIKLSL